MNGLIGIGLLVGFLALLGGTAWYVPTRLAALWDVERRRRLRVGWAVAVVASTLSIGLATPPSTVAGVLYILGGWLFVLHGYVLMMLLVLHALHRWIPISGAAQAWGTLAVALATTVWGAVQADALEVREVEIAVGGLETELTVMHVSDVHLGHHRGRARLERVAELTNEQDPDFVVITGDLVDGNVAVDPEVLAPLGRIEAPVYFAYGNHETYVDLDRALALIAAQGVHVLRNELVETHGVQIIGLDYMNADDRAFDMHAAEGKATIENVLPTIATRDDAPLFLLHHSPVGLEYIEAHGTDLMFTGHTHAGQVFPGTVLAPFIFRLNAGLYQVDGMQVYVSQGAGTFGPRMRLGSTNELDVLKLRPGRSAAH